MTRDKAIEEMVEIECTFPIQPYTPEEAIRAKESWERHVDLHGYVYNKGPAPSETWKPSVPAPTGAERERYILHWAEVETSGRGLVSGHEGKGR